MADAPDEPTDSPARRSYQTLLVAASLAMFAIATTPITVWLMSSIPSAFGSVWFVGTDNQTHVNGTTEFVILALPTAGLVAAAVLIFSQSWRPGAAAKAGGWIGVASGLFLVGIAVLCVTDAVVAPIGGVSTPLSVAAMATAFALPGVVGAGVSGAALASFRSRRIAQFE